jgi:hypothetical protein
MVLNGPLEVVLIVAVIAYVLVRRMLGEPAQGKRMLLLPVILTGVGLLSYAKAPESATGTWVLVGSVVVSIVLGFLRGVSIRTLDRDGIVFMKYTALTLVLWAVNLGVKFGINLLVAAVDPSSAVSLSNGLLVSLGAGILVEGLVVMNKALRSEGRVIWQKGKKGAAHSTSGFLDGLQQSMRTPPASGAPTSAPDRPARTSAPTQRVIVHENPQQADAREENDADRGSVESPRSEPWVDALSALGAALRDRRSDRRSDRRR